MTDRKQKRKVVTLYTDGGCLGNPGPGGYGAVLLYGTHRKELSAGFRLTTNNRMELMAAIVGLEALTSPCQVELYTDSKYLITVAGAAPRWQRNRWRRDPRKPQTAANVDLLERLLVASQPHKINYHWVKGHADVPENERCDELATTAADTNADQTDEGFEREHPSDVAMLDANCEPPTGGAAKAKIVRAGQPCRKCGYPIEKKTPKRRQLKGKAFYYEYYFGCPRCKTMYFVDEAKRLLDS